MQFYSGFVYPLIGLLFAGLSIAAPTTGPATQPAAMDPALVPFVTAGTLMVAEVDTSRIDLNVIHDSLLAAAQTNVDPQRARRLIDLLYPQFPAARKWLQEFGNAGARMVCAVAYLGDPRQLPGVIIVPLSPSADSRKIAGLLVSGQPDGPDHADNAAGGCEAIVLHGAVVFGLNVQVEKMKSVLPVERPLLADGLAALGDAPIKIVVSPSIALQLVAGEFLPDNLPDAAGGGMPAMLVHTLAWAALGTSPPPDPFVHLIIQCKDADGAQGYSDMAAALLATLAADPDQRKLLPQLDRVVAALKPTVSGDLLSLDLDSRTLDDLIVPQLLLGLPLEPPPLPQVPDTRPLAP
jgi:hypothetical protein